jgi:mono/diheme cytochrome c family protein
LPDSADFKMGGTMAARCASAVAVFAGVAVLLGSGAALAQQLPRVDLGEREYASHCAVCHGPAGKGDGVYKQLLKKSPSDLTSLTKANKGVFPYQKTYEIIDGRQEVMAHGPREMPIWGNDYYAKGVTSYFNVPYDPELYVRIRIMALIDYLHRLQAE